MATLTPNGDAEVTIADRGQLTTSEVQDTAASGAPITLTQTVPVGKVWILKRQATLANGSHTLRLTTFQDPVTALKVEIDRNESPSNAEQVDLKGYTLTAGWRILTDFYTTGSSLQQSILLYQEYDA